jgi:hypothetical protein
MSIRFLSLAPLAALSLAALAKPAAPGGCRGTISGDAKASFACLADVTTAEGGKPVFVITPTDTLDGIPVYKPGAFELPAALAPGSYTLDELGMGMASVAVEGGALYTAAKTSSQRGEVKLTLQSVKADPGRAGAWVVHGTYRARLVPAGNARTGEVVVEVRF